MRGRPGIKDADPVFGPMLSDQEVADRLGWAKQTLQQRRSEGQPVPDYVKFSKRRCCTPESAVTKFIEKHLVLAETKCYTKSEINNQEVEK